MGREWAGRIWVVRNVEKRKKKKEEVWGATLIAWNVEEERFWRFWKAVLLWGMWCVIPLQCPLQTFGEDFCFLTAFWSWINFFWVTREQSSPALFGFTCILYDIFFFYKNGIACLPLLSVCPPLGIPHLSPVFLHLPHSLRPTPLQVPHYSQSLDRWPAPLLMTWLVGHVKWQFCHQWNLFYCKKLCWIGGFLNLLVSTKVRCTSSQPQESRVLCTCYESQGRTLNPLTHWVLVFESPK